MSKLHNLKNKDYVADVMRTVKDVATKFPLFMEFLEYYCGYNTPLNTSNPYEISYAGGKRDVILMLKTLGRDDLLPEQVAQHYERIL